MDDIFQGLKEGEEIPKGVIMQKRDNVLGLILVEELTNHVKL